ncbi:jg27658 [Pararge aegeria aegeria]|uniref:Jg27658 protein n=1 Tax=Pararge aegeria aegeria TaxID=348720 RepID=A0A8S4RMR9_9NEOP|nr:jg27658 [Pararge aegeria aegeria]
MRRSTPIPTVDLEASERKLEQAVLLETAVAGVIAGGAQELANGAPGLVSGLVNGAAQSLLGGLQGQRSIRLDINRNSSGVVDRICGAP